MLKADAKKRGGNTAGVQIFGTSTIVPTFNINYKVMMYNGQIDEGGEYQTGKASDDDILFVVYTERIVLIDGETEKEVIRIISARFATDYERGIYYGKN